MGRVGEGSAYRYQYSSLHYCVAFADENRGDGTGCLSLDVVLHLHGFEHDDCIADGNGIAHLDRYLGDGARERGNDLCTTTSLNRCWSRFWCRSRADDRCGCRFLYLYFRYLLAYRDRLLENYIEVYSVYVDLGECSLNLIDLYIVVNALYCILIFCHSKKLIKDPPPCPSHKGRGVVTTIYLKR